MKHMIYLPLKLPLNWRNTGRQKHQSTEKSVDLLKLGLPSFRRRLGSQFIRYTLLVHTHEGTPPITTHPKGVLLN